MKNIIVSKFGGTSMANALCMLRSATVSVQQKSSLIVVSATSGTTNKLIELGEHARNSNLEAAEKVFQEIYNKHQQIASDLKLSPGKQLQLSELFNELNSLSKGIFYLKDCSPRASDVLISMGERISSVLFSQAMENVLKEMNQNSKVILYDVRKVIKTDDQFGKARPLTEVINREGKLFFSDILNSNCIGVTQGFIGSTLDGQTSTLGRGGSDFSAAILAEAIDAKILEIWTDVAGVATTDPRIVPQAKLIDELSFKEASELATFGAKVLHPATLLPAIKKNIPVFVGSSFEPDKKGTWIKKDVPSHPLIRAMALRKNQALLTLSTPEMLQTHGFLFQVFKIFNDLKISIDAITTSEISVSMTLDDSTLLNKTLVERLSEIAEVQIEENFSLVSLIGNHINHTPGISKKIFETISDINVRMICLGASKHNFCFLVSEDQAEEALKRLHKVFFPTHF